MIDIRIIAIRDLLPIVTVLELEGAPRSLDIVGKRFMQADTVLINGLSAEEFIVVSDSRILAQVPKSQKDATIRGVTVLAERPSKDRSSLLQLEVGSTFKSLEGIQKLVQFFAKILLQTPGTDRFRPDLGGGLASIVGQQVGKSDSRSLTTSAIEAVNRTKDQVVRVQNTNLRIPIDEKLLMARVENIAFDAGNTSLNLRVFLSAVSGAEAVSNLTF